MPGHVGGADSRKDQGNLYEGFDLSDPQAEMSSLSAMRTSSANDFACILRMT
jgi:hypothetical protein